MAQTSDQHLFQSKGLKPQQQYQLQAKAVDFQTTSAGITNPKTVFGQVLSINGHANQLVLLQLAECSPLLACTD